MQYKTIVLELLEQRSQLYEELRKNHQVLPTVETLAAELREHHMALTEWLENHHPDSDQSQIPAQALEIAVKDLEDHLPPVSATDDPAELSLDGAMAFLRNHSRKE